MLVSDKPTLVICRRLWLAAFICFDDANGNLLLLCHASPAATPHTSWACGVWTARCHTSTHGTKPTASQNPTPCICQKRSASTSGKRTFPYIKNTLKSPSDFEGLFCSKNYTCINGKLYTLKCPTIHVKLPDLTSIVFRPHISCQFFHLWTSGDYHVIKNHISCFFLPQEFFCFNFFC